MKYTRQDYMNNKCSHREYYAQFVTDDTKNYVLLRIGRDRIVNSKDEHFNDIPLKLWDLAVPHAPGSRGFKEAGDWYSLGTGVCMLKEAARQIKESEAL